MPFSIRSTITIINPIFSVRIFGDAKFISSRSFYFADITANDIFTSSSISPNTPLIAPLTFTDKKKPDQPHYCGEQIQSALAKEETHWTRVFPESVFPARYSFGSFGWQNKTVEDRRSEWQLGKEIRPFFSLIFAFLYLCIVFYTDCIYNNKKGEIAYGIEIRRLHG